MQPLKQKLQNFIIIYFRPEQVYSDSEQSAADLVRKGEAWAAVTFSHNFTASVMARAAYTSLYDVKDYILESGSVEIAMDNSGEPSQG